MLTISDNEIQKFLGSTTNFKESDLHDAIGIVLKRYVIPYLSEAQLNVSVASSSNIHIVLMDTVKRAVVNLAYAKDFMNFVLTKEISGLKDKTVKEAKASKEDKEKVQEQHWNEGFTSIDEMLAILEENQNTFTQWASSDSYTLIKSSFVSSTKIFNDFVDIGMSRRTFYRLRANIRTVEQIILPIAVDINLLTALKSDYQNSTLTPLKKEIITYIQALITNYAIADALIKGSIIKNKYNTFSVYDDTQLAKTEGHKTADLALLEKAQKEYENTAKQYQKQLNILINANLVALGITPAVKREGLKPVNKVTDGYCIM